MDMVDLEREAINDLAEDDGPYLHPPGHPDAISDGCKCPVVENGHGKWSGQFDEHGFSLYWFNVDCPYHVEK